MINTKGKRVTVTITVEGEPETSMTLSSNEFLAMIAVPACDAMDDGEFAWKSAEEDPERHAVLSEFALALMRAGLHRR